MRRLQSVLQHVAHADADCASSRSDFALLPHPIEQQQLTASARAQAVLATASSPTLLLSAERQQASFSPTLLTHFLDGGEEVTALKATVAASIESDPVLNPPSAAFALSRSQMRRSSMAKIRQCAEMVRAQLAERREAAGSSSSSSKGAGGGPQQEELQGGAGRAGVGAAFESAFYSLMALLDPSWATRMGVHFGLFASALSSQATQEQKQRWQRAVEEMQLIGCFAMTELGHGSNVAGIETTATWTGGGAEAGGRFVLHSPTVTATKWWIGGAADMATHAAVYARLISADGRDRGLRCFLVPIRDPRTGAVKPGVVLGDMGDKMGRNGLDNGWLRFERCVLPYSALLTRWGGLDADGRWVEEQQATGRAAYTALIQTRVELFGQCSDVLKQAVTIAVRYAAVRRQGWRAGRGGEETQLIDYETHQRRLFPIIANAIAIQFTAKEVQSSVQRAVAALSSSASSLSLESVHATTAGLKAFATWYVNDAIEVCRQSLGGAGYSVYALLPSVRNDWAVMCTWEGDNTVLALHCAKHIIHRVYTTAATTAAAADDDAFAYLTAAILPLPSPVNAAALSSPAFLLSLYRLRVLHCMSELSALSASPSVLLSAHATACIDLARHHCDYFQLRCCVTAVTAAPPALSAVLTSLCLLSALSSISASPAGFLTACLLSPAELRLLPPLLSALLASVRRDAVSLTDAFALPDFVLGPLGRKDGNVYDAMFDMVRQGGATGGGGGGGSGGSAAAEYWDELVRPLTEAGCCSL